MTEGTEGGHARESSSFEQLHEKVQRWIWQKGWEDLRDIQEKSIPLLVGADRDLIIAASTASGKTEAAFLPIVSRLAWDGYSNGFGAIYIGPLRALINDQFGRLESLCEELEIPVVKWHGDVSASKKAKARKKPEGILLITPESIEALFVRRGAEAETLFRNLRYVVIDELHAFIGAPRGKQLQSLMHRIETVARRRIPRVGLSATLASMESSAEFLRPSDPHDVAILESKSSGQEVKLQLRGYIAPIAPAKAEDKNGEAKDLVSIEIAKHIYDTLRGKRGLLFAGSRNRVELFTATLNELTEANGVPEEFFAHHGSLSREYREHAEQRMKQENLPASIVCTTTLELGIDIGHIDSVAQLGPGHTVSGMRQRLGRSGRRPGMPAVMRIYVEEEEFGREIHPLDALRRRTVQSVAMVNLMLAKWNEPPASEKLHLSTLVHQILALVMQHGGISARYAWAMLVESGVFKNINVNVFKALLRRMADPEVKLLEQAPDGTLLPGEEGERLTSSRDFYTVFHTPDEYRVISDKGRSLGTLPIEHPYLPGDLLIFAGKRWRIVEIDPARREIVLARSYGGNPPIFGGDAVPPADGVVAEMRRVYQDINVPAFLNEGAIGLLREARLAFDRYDLRRLHHIRHGDMLLLLPWVGPQAQLTLLLALAGGDLEPMPLGLAIGIKQEKETKFRRALELLAAAPADPLELAHRMEDKLRDKFDFYIGDDLLAQALSKELALDILPMLAGRLRDSFELEETEADLGPSSADDRVG